jgi:hypothetical protein
LAGSEVQKPVINRHQDHRNQMEWSEVFQIKSRTITTKFKKLP